MLIRNIGFWALLVGLFLSGCRGDQEKSAATPAAPSQVAVQALAPAAVQPGETFLIGWKFDLAEGWHLYGNGRNDSGYPPSVKLELPAGWQAGPLLWPVPERYLSPGEILDHVYHGQLLLLQEVTAPAEAAPGNLVSIPAQVDWLACRDECVPGRAGLELPIMVAEQSLPGPDAGTLNQAHARLPQPAPADEVAFSWTADAVEVVVSGAAGLEFQPAMDCGLLVDLITDGTGDADRLILRLRQKDGRIGPLTGILRQKMPDGSWRNWTIDSHPGG